MGICKIFDPLGTPEIGTSPVISMEYKPNTRQPGYAERMMMGMSSAASYSAYAAAPMKYNTSTYN